MFCTSCGVKMDLNSRYCSQCGHQVGTEPGPLPSSNARNSSAEAPPPPLPQRQAHLTRSLRNRKIAGVCGGLGRYFQVDPTLVRIIFVGAFLCGILPSVLPYIICWVVMPLEDPEPVSVTVVPSTSPLPPAPYGPVAPMPR